MSEPTVGATSSDDWNRHWDEYSESATLNPAQRYRQRLITRALGRAGPPVRLLDVGSGQGDLLAVLSTTWPASEYAGVELSASGVEQSRAKLPDIRFVERDLLAPGPAPEDLTNWATHAVCSEVLEHVDEPVVMLRNLRAFLAPGARLVVTVPAGPRSAFDRHIGHRRHYTPCELESLLREAGFDCDEPRRAGFPFFQLYRLMVLLRGRRLIEDVAANPDGPASRGALALMRAFDVAFRANLDRSPWGWQLWAVARVRG